jgi:endo-1,4-beta-D-glucanase Y
MSIKILIACFFILFNAATISTAQQPKFPFPQHVSYFTGTVLPNHISQKEMDHAVSSFYNEWKERYILKGCTPGQYYVWFEKTKGDRQCVSEGQGYGMIIVALMTGYDTAAKTIYDGLFRYVQSHPTKEHRQLMSWAQEKNCKDLDGSSATDGDMDIAYSLLLADKQWGSKGSIDYLHEAIGMIASIMLFEINLKTYSILLSDAIEKYSKDFFDMRSSDFMPAHLKAFQIASGDLRWNKVLDNNYVLFRDLQKQYSNEAGLLPDFIQHIDKNAQPAHPGYLESRKDGLYNYNACRIPWRLATDYLLYGDPRSKTILEKINLWIRETTQNNPDNISAGYTLNGEDLKKRNYEALSFIAPFAVAAMIDPKNQSWLNSLWNYIIQFKLESFDYYDNSIKMLNLLLLSGNYWKP